MRLDASAKEQDADERLREMRRDVVEGATRDVGIRPISKTRRQPIGQNWRLGSGREFERESRRVFWLAFGPDIVR